MVQSMAYITQNKYADSSSMKISWDLTNYAPDLSQWKNLDEVQLRLQVCDKLGPTCGSWELSPHEVTPTAKALNFLIKHEEDGKYFLMQFCL